MIAFEKLAALALDELAEADAAEVELHVLECGACALTLGRLLALGSAVRALVLAGKVRTFLSPELCARLAELGLVSRRYRLAPDQVVPCEVGDQDVYALVELEADLRGVGRVDLVVSAVGVGELRANDVPFDVDSGTVAFVDPSDALRKLPSTRVELRLLAVEPGSERELARYVLDHRAGRQ